MPTFNRKHCIKNAIDSVLAQTYQKFELIIIDDGSSDGTEAYIKILYGEDLAREKIKYVLLPKNKGAAVARNEGLEVAKYDWIGYLDTDNRMHSDFLETFTDSIEKNSGNEIFYSQMRRSETRVIIGHDFDFYELVHNNFIDLGVFVHSRKLYNELGGFDINLKRLIDWDLIIRYTEKHEPIFIEKILLDYYDGIGFSRITNEIAFDENYKKTIFNHFERLSAKKFIEEYNFFYSQIQSKEQEIQSKEQEIQFMKSSKFWILRERYIRIRKSILREK